MEHKRRGTVIYRFIVLIMLLFFLPTPARADCLSPAAPAGKVIFDGASSSLQYCNGSTWVKFPKLDPATGWAKITGGGIWNDPFSCGITNDGIGWCWGTDTSGRLGNGAALTTMQTTPSLIAGGHRWAQISVHERHACGIRTDGAAMCWGAGGYGRLANGSWADSDIPILVPGGYTWSKISAGREHSCGIRTDGVAMCWGRDHAGQLGNGAMGDALTPGVVNGGYSWADIRATFDHTCGVTTSGTGYCWGRAADGRLGNGTTTPDVQIPSLVLGGHTWQKIGTANGRSCGITTAGAAYCWGSDYEGRLGNGGANTDVSSPSPVSGAYQFRDIDVSDDSTCGLTAANAQYCWGSEAWGSAGFYGVYSTPTNVSHGHAWSTIGGGAAVRCGIRTDNVAMCWGRANTGALGNGDASLPDQYTPILVGGTTGACSDSNAFTTMASPVVTNFAEILYNNGRFVATGSHHGTNNAIYSDDGVTWTAASQSMWAGPIAYGNGTYVALERYGGGNVVRSSDGITWTAPATALQANTWQAVTFGNGVFVAVSSNGTNRVATSTDGITWTPRNAALATEWYDVAYGNGLFVAVSHEWNAANKVMTSPDGINWTVRNAAGPGWDSFLGITFGNGLFVAVGNGNGGGASLMTSPDGINWTHRTMPENNFWTDVTYGGGRFMAVSIDGTNRAMTSTDGITWTSVAGTAANYWSGVTYGNNRFIGVADDGAQRIMSSSCIGYCANPTEPAGSIIYNNDRRVMQWCDGTSWQAMGPDNPGGASGGCSNPTGGAGDILYNSAYNIPQYCDGGIWRAVGAFDACQFAGAPAGTVCQDGSHYAGISPDGNVKMYTTPADAGLYRWNNGTSNWIDTSIPNCGTPPPGGGAACSNGNGHTLTLAVLVDGASPYAAAQYCNDLSAHGKTDWYLPAQNEMYVMYQNMVGIGGFSSAEYWTSSENGNNDAVIVNLSNGNVSNRDKDNNYRIRCVRQ